MHLQVAVPIKPKPKPRLKKKDPAHAVQLTEEEEFQETFNLAKRTQTGLILNVRSSQMSSESTRDANDLLPSRKAKSKRPSVQSRASDEDLDDDADDLPPSRKAKSKHPSVQSRAPDEDLDDDADDLPPSRKAKSKCPSMQSRAPDEDLDDDADDLPPSRKAKSKRPSVQSRAPDEDLDNDADDLPLSRKAKSKSPSVQSRAPDEDPDDDADDLPPSRKAKSKRPSVQSRAPDDDADDLPPSRKAKSKPPSVQSLDPVNVDTNQPPSSHTEKSKRPPSHPQGPANNVNDADQPPPSRKEMSRRNNEHSRDSDDGNRADVPLPARKETSKSPQDHPSFRKESKRASPSPKSRDVDNNVQDSPPTPRANSRRRSTATAHVSPTTDLEMDSAPNQPDQDDETLAEDENVEQLVLGPDASSEDSCRSSSLSRAVLEVDFAQIEDEEDPYVEPERIDRNRAQCEADLEEEDDPEPKGVDADAWEDGDLEEDTYQPLDEEDEEDEEVPPPRKQIHTKGKAAKAPSKAPAGEGRKKKGKRVTLLSDLDQSDKSEEEPEGRKIKKGPLSKEALAECKEFGREMEERAKALSKKYGKKVHSIFTAASLSTSTSRKGTVWNMHQSWFYATQGIDGEEAEELRARQKVHYKVLRDSEEGEEKWDIVRQYYMETAAGVDSGPKSTVGHVMAVRDHQ
ncbi:hypothetical protein HYDPIDRAFT_33100 [Hydnomerulius pinastri MD-312]|uniref:Uncharacterized protein n=1 Tax=Hydnomerulius pinastri MD-312 TaxID=994086 RepID=A0A0C9W8V9_9AGAM|nr:hypothetical protein HYDPIDRAFT_33100 [Hydnomerulius pinastri MD-312]